MNSEQIISLALASVFIGSVFKFDEFKREHFTQQMFYEAQNPTNVSDNKRYSGPNGASPESQTNVSLEASGDQLLAYQLYQQGINAATPTKQQLDSISGNAYQQTGNDSELQGGVSSEFAPFNVLGNGSPSLYTSEYQAVNFGSSQADRISACAQNAPNFVATSLLPKPSVPGQDSWDIGAPQDILATQNFLSAVQQIGTDTVLSSNRNPSYDLRNNIPNPINVVAPWLQSTITPDLERRQLDCFIPADGVYGCAPAGANTNGTYVGYSD